MRHTPIDTCPEGQVIWHDGDLWRHIETQQACDRMGKAERLPGYSGVTWAVWCAAAVLLVIFLVWRVFG